MHGTCVTCRARLRVDDGMRTGVLVECPACSEVMKLQADVLSIATPEEAQSGVRVVAEQQDHKSTAPGTGDETVVLDAQSVPQEKGAWLLRVENGERAGEIVPLPNGTTTLGRSEGDICFADDAEASRKHAALDVYGLQRLVLRDLASSNGTQVNGRPVTQTEIHHGDVVRLGRTECTLLSSDQLADRT